MNTLDRHQSFILNIIFSLCSYVKFWPTYYLTGVKRTVKWSKIADPSELANLGKTGAPVPPISNQMKKALNLPQYHAVNKNPAVKKLLDAMKNMTPSTLNLFLEKTVSSLNEYGLYFSQIQHGSVQ